MKRPSLLFGLLGILFIVTSSHASGYFNLGFSIGRGYGNYYPATGYPAYGWGAGGNAFAGIGGVCGNACSIPHPCINSCSNYNPYYMNAPGPGGVFMPGLNGGLNGGLINGGMINGGLNGGLGGLPGLNGGIINGGLNGGLPGLNGGLNGGLAMPAMPMLPPPQPFIPPHLQNNNAGWGPGFASYPMPGMAPIPGSIPCNAGYLQQPIYPVAGGPVIHGGCSSPYAGCYATGAASGLNRSIAGWGSGGYTIIDMRSRNEWEKNDTGEIVFNAGLGMSSMLTNVYPVAFPRSQPPHMPSGWFSFGYRDPYFYPRPTH